MSSEVTAPRPHRLSIALSVALLLVVSVTAAAQAVPMGYQFIQFDVPGGGQTELIGINNRGQVVGSYGPGLPNSGLGFLYVGGVITPIRVPDSIETHPYGINDAGDIVGEYLTPSGYSAFLLRDGVYTTPIPGGQGRAINNAGQIVGLGVGTGGSFIWSEGDISTLIYPDGTAAFAYDINDQGDIAGQLSGPAGFRFSQEVVQHEQCR